MTKCIECETWKKALSEALEKSESIFDAYNDMLSFEKKCSSNCPYKEKTTENQVTQNRETSIVQNQVINKVTAQGR